MKRFKHSLSHYNLSTFDMGQLVPIGNFEVLPGDSIRMSTSALLRVSPLVTPVMHPVNCRIHHWFVPYRVLWDQFEDFITGGPDGTGSADPFPTVTVDNSYTVTNLPNYFGVPLITGANSIAINALPFRAYARIWNEFYRDQDLQAEQNPNTVHGGGLLRICWEKDYATAARPWAQKGPDITVPLAGLAPVRGLGIDASAGTWQAGTMNVDETARGNVNYANWANANVADNLKVEGVGNAPTVYADLAQAQSPDINAWRAAFALQRYQEARAQFGSRYTEYLRYLGIRSSDARLQRPEYLGGGRSTIAFSEVLRTGNDTGSTEPIGQMAGHGISAMKTRSFVKFFEEHGIVISLASLRPRSIYADGLHRQWSRTTKEDFYQKELEAIGQQQVFNKEVYISHATPNGEFGFGDRYSEYKHHPSYVAGEFRTVLNDWHMARIFGSAPALNDDFVECVPTKRIHAEQTQNSIWGMFSHSIQARRMVGHKTIGRLF